VIRPADAAADRTASITGVALSAGRPVVTLPAARAAPADPTPAQRSADPGPGERWALLDELRRRIAGLERRPAADAARLPPAPPPPAAAPDQRQLAELDGAEEAAWGARLRARVRPRFFGSMPGGGAPLWMGRLAGTTPIAAGLAGVRVLDCETTGLAGATGTVAFLVGVGWFDGDDGTLQVEQLVLRRPAAEAAFLDALLALLCGGKALVTFNGRSFDGPLLRTRCILARRRPGPLAGLPHIDLLPVARRLWRHRGADCRLVSLEDGVLGRRRAEDVPGMFAPAAYADFLRGGDPAALEPIIAHNRDDVVGTAGLLLAALRILDEPLRHAEDAGELRGAADQRLAHEGPEAALPILHRALELARTPALRRQLLAQLARVERRRERHDASAVAWERYAREFPRENKGFVELAKVLERRRRDPAAALGVLGRVPHPAAVDVGPRRARLEGRIARAARLEPGARPAPRAQQKPAREARPAREAEPGAASMLESAPSAAKRPKKRRRAAAAPPTPSPENSTGRASPTAEAQADEGATRELAGGQ
jgi:hypothetical protein